MNTFRFQLLILTLLGLTLASAQQFTQQGDKLIGSGFDLSNSAVYQGWAISLSGDGNTLAVGGPYDNINSDGAVWIFSKTSSSTGNTFWQQQGPKLLGSGFNDSTSFVSQGWSVSLSMDGNTLAFGGIGDSGNLGASWVFTRSSTSTGTLAWNQQGSKLVGTGSVGTNVQQGYAIALSADGSTLAVGGNNDNTGIGAVWVFVKPSTSAGNWNQQGSKLIGTGFTGTSPSQGCSVSLSGNGNILAVGGSGDANDLGAVWLFARSTSTNTWNQLGSKLIGTGFTGSFIFQGKSISLSDDGNTLAVGGYGDANGLGAVWIFSYSSSTNTWTQQGNKLVANETQLTDYSVFQGWAVSLSGDGNTLAVGSPYDSNNWIGATWIFSKSQNGQWNQQNDKLVGTGINGTSSIFQGQSVSLSYDGSVLAVGANNDDNGLGATWVFVQDIISCVGVEYENAFFPNSTVGIVNGICNPGYFGSPTRQCKSNGWDASVTSGCVAVFCGNDVASNAIWSSSPAIGETVSGVCNPGYYGSVSRVCSQSGANGVWSSVSGSCQVVSCVDDGASSAVWGSPQALGQTVYGICNNGLAGTIFRTCSQSGANGVWSSVYGQCFPVSCLDDGAGNATWGNPSALGESINGICKQYYTGNPTRTCSQLAPNSPYALWTPVSNPCIGVLTVTLTLPSNKAGTKSKVYMQIKGNQGQQTMILSSTGLPKGTSSYSFNGIDLGNLSSLTLLIYSTDSVKIQSAQVQQGNAIYATSFSSSNNILTSTTPITFILSL